jgi:hypothetical protein
MRNVSRFSKRLFISIGVLILIYFLGSLGYMLIEDLEFLDALFMTTITITTVGYGLVTDLSVAGTIYIYHHPYNRGDGSSGIYSYKYRRLCAL